MTFFARIVSGRRSKFAVLAAWIVALVALGPLIGSFESKQKNEPSSFLPEDAESVRALELAEQFPSGRGVSAIAVVAREDGLTEADREAISGVAADLADSPPEGVVAVIPPRFSEDGEAAIVFAQIVADGDEKVLIGAVDGLREGLAGLPEGLEARITGPAGYSADASEVFEGINSTLLIATSLLVFVLLVLIYRSPIFWILPLLSVFFAEGLVRGIGALLVDAGVVVNGQTGGILLVLVFGAGTDYALLLTSRYREELHRHEDKHDAMRIAVRRAGPGIVASAATVVAALLCLSFASVNSTAGLGPVGAMGVAIAATAMLTVLPALLLIGGRRAFWPYLPRFDRADPEESDTAWRHGFWGRLGARIERRHRLVWIVTTLGLAALALGTLTLDSNLTTANAFRGEVEAVEGQRLLERSFPAGASAPTTVIVTNPAALQPVVEAAQQAPQVVSVGEIEQGDPGALFTVTLTEDPFSEAGFGLIDPLRDELRVAGRDAVLVGGATAEEHDLREAVRSDTLFLVPLVLIVVFAILVLLLRAVVGPLMLIATVVLSFFAALGLALVVFELFADFPGEDPSYPLFAFIFLVALGIDYNIFLMARVREEAQSQSTKGAMLKGLAVTGGVITSAGIVLAGTFSVLAVLPLVALTQIGITVALGVLLDTFVVRSILVPALTFSLGERTWWPSKLGRR
ncbi:MAG TPA: MMPL family transporter [Gaiellaceae bacterium]|nr:MMPL family transporter [Gaiellaceae bacterium]